MTIAAPALMFAFELRAEVAPPIDLGDTPRGRRRIVPIVGGSFDGPELKGRLLPGGADWQLIHPDGSSELDSRYTLETTTGDLIAVQNQGIRHASPEVMARLLAGDAVAPEVVYFKTTPRFETAAPPLQWLTRAIFIGDGERQPSIVIVRFWRVL